MDDRKKKATLKNYETAGDKREVIQPEVAGMSVLDVGCLGTDSITGLHDQIRQWANSTIGIDVNEQLAKKVHDVRVADAQKFTLESPVDTVVAGDLIEHLPNPGQFIERSEVNLKQGGRLVIATPNAMGYRHFQNRFFYA
jgi:2-polyprenyl-3-methyl-5-hydroxy-6-metoxy-1,4-benzoquinol methylase